MADDDSTGNDRIDTNLPKFSVNVVPTQEAAGHLSTVLTRFRSGSTKPLIFGDGNTPEAAVIPFSDFVRLMKHDHATQVRDEHAFGDELTRRIQDSDVARARGEEPGMALDELGESLGEPAASILREIQDDDA